MGGLAGVDPRPFSLRQLVWMADAREQAGWFRTFAVVRQVAGTGSRPRRVEPAEVIPDRHLPDKARPKPETAEERENRERLANDQAWAALGEGLKAGLKG